MAEAEISQDATASNVPPIPPWLGSLAFGLPSALICASAVYGLTFADTKLRAVFVIVAASVVATLTGIVLGFIFGIPKSAHKKEKKKTAQNYVSNTSLERVSDWLTALILGVGLIQFREIMTSLHQLTVTIAASVDPPGGPSSQVPIALITSATFISGFFCAYLYTATRLVHMFDQVARVLQQQNVNDAAAVRRTNSVLVSGAPEQDSQGRTTLFADGPSDLEGLLRSASAATREIIYGMAAQQRKTNWDWRSLPSPQDARARSQHDATLPVFEALSRLQPQDPRFHGDLGFALRDCANPDYMRSIQELTKAIKLSKKQSADPKGVAWYHFTRATAIARHLASHDFQEPHWAKLDKMARDDAETARSYGGSLTDIVNENQELRPYLPNHASSQGRQYL